MDFFKDKSPSLYLWKVEVNHSNFFKNKHPVNGGKNLNADMLKSVQITYFGPFTNFANVKSYIETCRKSGINEIMSLQRLAQGKPYTVADIFKT